MYCPAAKFPIKTTRLGALLICDEVMTGWRVHPAGAQRLYNVTPDLTCLGKVIGGGLPAAAYGGRRDLMQQMAPVGPVYQAGTLSGNPLAMTAGLVTLDVAARENAWSLAEGWAAAACDLLEQEARRAGIPVTVQRVGTMFTPFFTAAPVTDYATARATDRVAYGRFFHAMLEAGIYLAPSAFEAAFTSSAHRTPELEHFARALPAALRATKR